MTTRADSELEASPEHGGSTNDIPTTMRAAVARSYGPAEVISIEQIPVPVPGDDEVLVRVEASSLNALDWHYLTGTPYFMRLMVGLRRPKRIVPGADVAGTVVATGSAVTTFKTGDAVFGECDGGGCGLYLTVEASHLASKPDTVSFEATGATPVAGLTALQGLRTHGAVKVGDQVLINGAAGGVGTFAVQIAKALGAEVTAVCGARNVDMVRRLGADHVIDYESDDFVTRGGQFDVMMDNVGNRKAAECLSMLRSSGRYVVISGPKKNRWLGPVPKILGTAIRFRFAKQTFHQFTASPNQDDLTFLGELLARAQVVPEVQRTIGLDAVADGLAEIGTGHTRAKIVVKPH